MSASNPDQPQHVSLRNSQLSDPFFPESPPPVLTALSDRSPKKRRVSVIDTESSAQAAAPYLARHKPNKYSTERFVQSTSESMRTYCNRHNPEAKCLRQADEPSMEELQQELHRLDSSDQQGISTVWSLFSAAPSKQRQLMLQGILTVCCFPQLSFVSATVRDMIKIDFLSMLPAELSFKILSYLDTVSLCKAAQVCRKWNQLAEDDVVWHKMCEQHIAKKCKRCGWGLPVPEKNRLLKERAAMDQRAIRFDAASPPESSQSRAVELHAGCKRPSEDDIDGDEVQERKRTRLPWKEVYRNRFKVGTNWKYGRHTLKVLKGHKNGVMCLQYQDNILASGSYDATIKIWNLDTGEELRTLEGHTSGIRCLQFQKGQLISGAMDKTIKVWNWQTGECYRTFNEPMGDVLTVNYVANYLCSGGKDNNVKVWDFSSKMCHTLRGHGDFVNSVRVDPVSRTLFSGSDDCTVRLWDLDTRQVLKTFHGHVGGVQQVVLLPEEFDLDEVDLRDCDHPSDTEDQEQESLRSERDRSSLPNLPLFPHDPNRKNPPAFMMTASLDSTIRLWHVPTAHCLRTFFGHVEGIWALVADNLRVISGAEDRMVKVWDPRSGVCERTYAGHLGSVTCVASSGERLITGSEDCTIRVMEFGV